MHRICVATVGTEDVNLKRKINLTPLQRLKRNKLKPMRSDIVFSGGGGAGGGIISAKLAIRNLKQQDVVKKTRRQNY